MQKEIREKVKDLQQKIKNARDCNEDLKAVKKLFPSAYLWIDYEVNMSLPVKSMDEVKQALKDFAKAGIMIDHVQESDIQPVWKMKGKVVGIRLTPEWLKGEEAEAQGATCRLVKVGEETYTQNKYKLVCDDKTAV